MAVTCLQFQTFDGEFLFIKSGINLSLLPRPWKAELGYKQRLT